ICAELPRRLQEIVELNRLITGNTRDRRFAGHVALRERIDHGLTEARFIIQHVMSDAEGLGDPPCIVDVLAGAAGAGAVGGSAMIVKLERNANDLVPFSRENPRDNGRVYAARHRDDDARVLRTSWKVKAVHDHVSVLLPR